MPVNKASLKMLTVSCLKLKLLFQIAQQHQQLQKHPKLLHALVTKSPCVQIIKNPNSVMVLTLVRRVRESSIVQKVTPNLFQKHVEPNQSRVAQQ